MRLYLNSSATGRSVGRSVGNKGCRALGGSLQKDKVVVLCLVFLVLAGNSFWGFVHLVLIVQYSCAVVSIFGSGGISILDLHILMYLGYNTIVVLC